MRHLALHGSLNFVQVYLYEGNRHLVDCNHHVYHAYQIPSHLEQQNDHIRIHFNRFKDLRPSFT